MRIWITASASSHLYRTLPVVNLRGWAPKNNSFLQKPRNKNPLFFSKQLIEALLGVIYKFTWKLLYYCKRTFTMWWAKHKKKMAVFRKYSAIKHSLFWWCLWFNFAPMCFFSKGRGPWNQFPRTYIGRNKNISILAYNTWSGLSLRVLDTTREVNP